MYELICSYCGKKIVRTHPQRYNNVFCSRECESKFKSGKSKRNKKTNNILIKGSKAIIEIENNFLGKLEALIDIEDISKVKNYFWNVRIDKRHPNCTVYVESHKNGKRIHLHRLLTNCPKNLVIDHIDGNGLNNTKANLRIVTQKQNCINKNIQSFKGYSYNKRDKYYLVYIAKRVLGRFRTEQEAIEYRKYIDTLIKNGDWNTLDNLKCIKLSSKKNTTNF